MHGVASLVGNDPTTCALEKRRSIHLS